jgi:hypothetical protein
VIYASKWRWATVVRSVLSAFRALKRCGGKLVEVRRCLSRRVAIGLKSFCPSAALLEAAFAVFSSAACRDISAGRWRRVGMRLRAAFWLKGLGKEGGKEEGSKGRSYRLDTGVFSLGCDPGYDPGVWLRSRRGCCDLLRSRCGEPGSGCGG